MVFLSAWSTCSIATGFSQSQYLNKVFAYYSSVSFYKKMLIINFLRSYYLYVSMRDNKRRIESIIKKVKQVIETEDWERRDLFVTEKGNRLRMILEEVEEFTIKGMSLSLLEKILLSFPRLAAKWLQSDKFKELTQESIDNSDIHMIEAIQTILIQEPNLFDEIESDSFFKAEDHMRFFAYFIFSVCAYLDGFVQELTEEIIKEISRKASNYDKDAKRKYIAIFRKIFKTERSSSYERIKALLKSYGVSKEFKRGLEINALEYLETCFAAFIDLRNVITHKYPHPKQTIFTKFPPLKAYLEMDMPVITDMREELLKIPEEFRNAIELIIEVLKENKMVITAIGKFTNLVLIYLALVDNIIEMELENFSNFATSIN